MTDADDTITVIALNVFTPVMEPFRFTSQRHRLRLMSLILPKMAPDVFCFSELLIPTITDDFFRPLARRGYPYCTQSILAGIPVPALLCGGVYIVSKWPILQQRHHTYTHVSGIDQVAAKGAVWAQLNVRGRHVNIVATHLQQAWGSADGLAVRDGQVHELSDFISSLPIPSTETLILAGDLNIDRNSDAMRSFCDAVGVQTPTFAGTGPQFTVSRQNALHGNDDPKQYVTADWPRGCYDVYMATLECVCCPNEWIDYVLARGVVVDPLEAVPIRTDKPYRAQFNITTFHEIRDLSDHYAVVGRVRVSGSGKEIAPDPETRMSSGSDLSDSDVGTGACGTGGASSGSSSSPVCSAITTFVIVTLIAVVIFLAWLARFFYQNGKEGEEKLLREWRRWTTWNSKKKKEKDETKKQEIKEKENASQ